MQIRVHQRADAFNEIGAPKSEAGERTVPVPPLVANALKEWKLACPKGKLDLVFPNGAGNIESHANIVNRGLVPAMLAAGVTAPVFDEAGQPTVDDKGQPIVKAKYTGLHALRHFYASWCINPLHAGGQGLTPKVVQERLGHSSIIMTMDVYGHLFPRMTTARPWRPLRRHFWGSSMSHPCRMEFPGTVGNGRKVVEFQCNMNATWATVEKADAGHNHLIFQGNLW